MILVRVIIIIVLGLLYLEEIQIFVFFFIVYVVHPINEPRRHHFADHGIYELNEPFEAAAEGLEEGPGADEDDV